ncbi:ATP-binding cassette domain-containing protein [Candidatus Pelagibacter sp. RS39]|uniref:ATP-binding cassette domain-containing protein n=1 Tax=Candidatus Pelagibacter sp. RS39 TaxID=1977864 RepID=UPI000A15F485|nr:ATP-binding cassette domain-containing protein [Candidatus Pelagibacter sp. RS39]ARJ47442.1 sulfate transporter [Candidatus Pelagibacter sp. RS39]
MAIIKKFRIKNFKQEKELLRLDKISLYFGKRKILEDLSLSLNQGEILGLLGPNGVGKSTIFNLIIGLLKPNYGSVFIEKKNVTQDPIFYRTKNYKIGYVPQHGGYFHDLTLRENLKAISEIVIEDKKLRDEKINLLISKFELEPLQNIKAEFLSGGQKKRLVISLALLSNPKILLLDEPFAALDIMTIKNLQQIIVDLQTQNNISIILCDHQARDLLTCVDLAIVLSNGRVIAKDTPNNLIKNIDAQNAYFGESFKIS